MNESPASIGSSQLPWGAFPFLVNWENVRPQINPCESPASTFFCGLACQLQRCAWHHPQFQARQCTSPPLDSGLRLCSCMSIQFCSWIICRHSCHLISSSCQAKQLLLGGDAGVGGFHPTGQEESQMSGIPARLVMITLILVASAF